MQMYKVTNEGRGETLVYRATGGAEKIPPGEARDILLNDGDALFIKRCQGKRNATLKIDPIGTHALDILEGRGPKPDEFRDELMDAEVIEDHGGVAEVGAAAQMRSGARKTRPRRRAR